MARQEVLFGDGAALFFVGYALRELARPLLFGQWRVPSPSPSLSLPLWSLS